MRHLLAVALLVYPALSASQAPYSAEPLQQSSFPEVEIEARSARITAWLEQNHQRLSQQQRQQPREDLFALIDAYVRLNGTALPARNAQLSRILRWAEPLGVVGAHLLYNHVRMPDEPEMRRLLSTTPNIEIALRGDLLHVAAPANHWSFEIPWYFMIGNAADQVTTGGQRQQVVMLSTGFGRNTHAPGSSQATLLFIHAPGAQLNPMVDTWTALMKLTDADPRQEIGVRGLVAQTRLDPDNGVQTEFVSWMTDAGPFAVIYSGLRGTYEQNRPHFLDFIRTLQTPPPARAGQ